MCVKIELHEIQSKIQKELTVKKQTFDQDLLKLISSLFILLMHESQKNQRSYAYWEKQEVKKLNREVKALYADKTQLSLGIVSGVIGVVGGALGCISLAYAPLNALSQGLTASSQGLQGLNTTIHAPKEGEKSYRQTLLELQKKRLDEAKQNAQTDKGKEDQFINALKQAEEQHHNEIGSFGR